MKCAIAKVNAIALLGCLSTTTLATENLLEEECKTLIWADEFAGNTIDEKNWEVVEGDGCDQNLCGWGNSELQWYKRENIAVDGGLLYVNARRELVQGSKEIKQFTSGKITSKNRFSRRYGRFEARIKLPGKRGTWPAFWMMPTKQKHTWPVEGEIDVMEQAGRNQKDFFEILGTLHFGDAWPNNQYLPHKLIRETKWSDDFQVFAVDWTQNKISWSVNGVIYATASPSDIKPSRWPFNNQAFYMILNLAVGGTLGGRVDSEFDSAELVVDYVRVYGDCQAET